MRSFASRAFVAMGVISALGLGCGSSGGGGACGGLKPLPSQPTPLGLPSSQVIEGGIQARITPQGMQKLESVIPTLFSNMLGGGFCASGSNTLVNVLGQKVVVCDHSDCPGGATGCPAFVYLDSAQRPSSNTPPPPFPPAAANDEDNKDRILITLNDSPDSPTMTVDATFDVLVPLWGELDTTFGNSGCYFYAYDTHVGDDSQDPIHIIVNIQLGVDPTTGELTIHLANNNPIQLVNLGLTMSATGGGVCDFIGSFLGDIVSFVSGALQSAIGNFIINLLRPQIDALLQSFLPKPPGLAGVVDTHALLANFDAPQGAALETFVVAGGYVASSNGGLTLGVMSGMNSDRDESTRTPDLVSESSLCVPIRPTPSLGVAPWNLPLQPARNDFTLLPADQFAGNPDPTYMGMPQDVAIGVSRTFLDLAGFHLYNSGTLCLAISGSALPQLNAGTLAVIAPSLSNIVTDKKAPLALVLRPQTPLDFTIGAGDMTDPLLHLGINDMRIDFYAWIEERYVRIFTVALDTNIGLNLTVTNMNMKPAIQPMITGLNANNIKVRVSNTDVLGEDPNQLAQVFPSLVNIAAGALGSAVPSVALPSVAGFSLDNLQITRVQTSQDDFLAIYGSIVNGTGAPLIDWSDPSHPHLAGELQTYAVLENISIPPVAELQKLAIPSVTLKLDASGNNGKPTEWAYRVDGGFWHEWSQDPHPTLQDPAFMLQGRHTLEIRSRVVNQWQTEDTTPSKLELLIDSIPPELHPALDADNKQQLDFNALDIVSDTSALKYAWDENGKRTAWTANATMPLHDALALTQGGAQPLKLYAIDEAGNVGEADVDVGSLDGFHGRSTNPPSSGCGCELGGASESSGSAGAIAIAMLALLVLLRRRAAAALGLVALVALFASGCGCSNAAGRCSVDDDCQRMMCPAGQIPACMQNACGCTPNLALGNVGRFSSMCIIGQEAYVSAYNTDYGDLMIGHVDPPGVVGNWDFVDGVPDEPPDQPSSQIRGGVSDPGDNVGEYTSIQVAASGDPVISYYDVTHKALKFASFGAIRWHNHTVDQGLGPEDTVGKWTSLSIGPDGKPMIAYSAIVFTATNSGEPEGQLRVATATTTQPQSSSDWSVQIVDARPLPLVATPDGGMMVDTGSLLPEGIAIMSSLARKSDGTPGIAYYDRTRGNLRYVEWDPMEMHWNPPVLLDGEAMDGSDTGDVGLYPSLTYDESGVGQISYEDATQDNLLYVNTMDKTPEVADDGYRPDDEMTQDGLPSPVYHLVGDSSSIAAASGQIVIAYQDSTAVQLRLALRDNTTGKWTSQVVAGHANPFAGAYGFYADLKVANGRAIISSYAINQQNDNLTPFWVEVFSVNIGSIM